MRTLDSIANADPLWRIEWKDADDMVVQVSIMNQEVYDDYIFRDIAVIIKEVGGATSVKITQIAGEQDDGD